jgi:hypothetical protein
MSCLATWLTGNISHHCCYQSDWSFNRADYYNCTNTLRHICSTHLHAKPSKDKLVKLLNDVRKPEMLLMTLEQLMGNHWPIERVQQTSQIWGEYGKMSCCLWSCVVLVRAVCLTADSSTYKHRSAFKAQSVPRTNRMHLIPLTYLYCHTVCHPHVSTGGNITVIMYQWNSVHSVGSWRTLYTFSDSVGSWRTLYTFCAFDRFLMHTVHIISVPDTHCTHSVGSWRTLYKLMLGKRNALTI